MYFPSKIEEIVEVLKSHQELSNTKIIAAFPYAYKPTRLESVIIAVSQGGIAGKNVSLGGGNYIVSYIVDVDIFIPHQKGTPCVDDTVDNVIFAISKLCPVSFEAGRISSDDELECFTAKCSFKFNK